MYKRIHVVNSNKQHDLKELAEKWAKGQLSVEEQERLEDWYMGFDDQEAILTDSRHQNADDLRSHMLKNIQSEAGIKGSPKRSFAFTRLIAVAASVLFAIGMAFLFYTNYTIGQKDSSLSADIGPGGNKAYLTLSNGQKILLSDAKTGKLADQGNMVVSKTSNGSITYERNGSTVPSTAGLNIITTPRGGIYHLVLADSTQVWLNAASSITYPVAFTGKDRLVSVTGEVYFEVAHDAAKPFKVTGRAQEIEVLGTHFNVNAYGNEPVTKTTLLQGSVRIHTGENQKILKPGQQAVVSGNHVTVKEAAINEVMAWKNGYFEFENLDIQSLMRQIARWYDVDVEFAGPISSETFTGRISMYKNISQILSIVEASQSVHITISGRRIMVKQ